LKNLDEIKYIIEDFNPSKYARSRNYTDGGVSRLSAFISRGVISTRTVFSILKEKGFKKNELEKFVQELAWRDYWQKKWQQIVNINIDIKQTQHPIYSNFSPSAIINANTGISAVDLGIKDLYQSGYMHNHLRMYTASICCNIGKYHWLNPAKWMYFHLLDGDWGSNALSWQWVAGTNSHKKYYANQQNVNKYCYSKDENTFLDFSYEELIQNNETPDQLIDQENFNLQTILPMVEGPLINQALPTYIYTSYNLDTNWDMDKKANRILLLEPSHFKDYPISKKVLDFIINQANMIEGIQLAVMNFDQFDILIKDKNTIHFKEHPFNLHFKGNITERDWLFPELEASGSFFNYWNKGLKKYQIL
jgi:deoxyribodipyrimidine photo-lyase